MTTRPKPARTTPTKVPPLAELPVTRAMLYGVRDELIARSDQTNARLDQVDARLDRVDARFSQVDARFDQVDAEFRALAAGNESFRAEIRANVARLQTLVEDQESRNRVVLEVVQGHNARFDRIEADIAELKDLVHEILRIVTKRP